MLTDLVRQPNRSVVAIVVAGWCLCGPPMVTPAESVPDPNDARARPAHVPEAVVLSDRAQDVRVTQETRVIYTVVEPYPAENLLRELVGKLEARGWKGLDHDPRNPHLETSTVHRWTEFIDAQWNDRRVRLEQWTGWFEDPEGNRVMLLLRYTDRSLESDDEVTVVMLHDVAERASATETTRFR